LFGPRWGRTTAGARRGLAPGCTGRYFCWTPLGSAGTGARRGLPPGCTRCHYCWTPLGSASAKTPAGSNNSDHRSYLWSAEGNMTSNPKWVEQDPEGVPHAPVTPVPTKSNCQAEPSPYLNNVNHSSYATNGCKPNHETKHISHEHLHSDSLPNRLWDKEPLAHIGETGTPCTF
jgi:hypothetical protein